MPACDPYHQDYPAILQLFVVSLSQLQGSSLLCHLMILLPLTAVYLSISKSNIKIKRLWRYIKINKCVSLQVVDYMLF
jgi:hypothetical protein